jgi:hypothetical protein
MDMKKCTNCKEHKDISEFKKSKRAKDGLDSWCKKCTSGLRAKNLESYRKTERARELKQKYNITLQDYENMRIAQNFKCAICNKVETESYNNKLCIDHDHKTRKVRDLLCDKCNVGLGSFLDNPKSLIKASKYLIRHRSKG